MESSGPSGNTSDSPNLLWAEVIGTMIAVLTLTLPLLVIAYYSSNSSIDSSIDPFISNPYSLPGARN